jgi:hypothetical protein
MVISPREATEDSILHGAPRAAVGREMKTVGASDVQAAGSLPRETRADRAPTVASGSRNSIEATGAGGVSRERLTAVDLKQPGAPIS